VAGTQVQIGAESDGPVTKLVARRGSTMVKVDAARTRLVSELERVLERRGRREER
jgi:hypothetical protein